VRRIALGCLLAAALVVSSAQAVSAKESARVESEDVPTTPFTTPASWTLRSTPVQLVQSGHLSAVSCSSSTQCMAVGSVVNTSGTDVAFTESMSGTTWTVQSIPDPHGNKGFLLGALSCASPTSCEAVGDYDKTASTMLATAETWNGASWSVQSVPDPSGAAYAQLNGVSCVSATSCEAVGEFENKGNEGVPLAEAWNGTSWSVESIPNPTGGAPTVVNGISCTSASACIAVGEYNTSSAEGVVLAEIWNGTAWALQSIPSPSNSAGFGAVVNGVSCGSASSCTTVGGYENKSGSNVPLAEAWNGTKWTIQTVAKAAGETAEGLDGISCPSASLCIAVGSYATSSAPGSTLAEKWNGSTWSVQSTPNPVSTVPTAVLNASLGSVSCRSSTACTAIGGFQNNNNLGSTLSLGDNWNGAGWTTLSTVNSETPTAYYFLGTSCPASTSCVGVGYYKSDLSYSDSLAEVWNGTAWSTESVPNPSGTVESQLYSVSCTSTTNCVAVGDYYTSTLVWMTLVETWNGSAWSVESTPNPAAGTDNILSSVSCTSPTSCAAVGSYINSSDAMVTLAETWNGSAWKIGSTPNPSGAFGSELEGVSCGSSTMCTAVGTYTTTQIGDWFTLVEVWNGSTWAIQSSPNKGQNDELVSASCISIAACTAVGSYENSSSGDQELLAEAWNGSAWTVQTTPDPAGESIAYLTGVSCTSAEACIAVGYWYFNSDGNQVPVAESWSGKTWKIENPPVATDSADNSLESVSCAAKTACMALGFYAGPPIGEYETLAEQYS
jgi:hypothetical protein